MKSDVYIALRSDGTGANANGTIDNPYDGSTDELLDNILKDGNKVPANATIHFGPGVFQTKGFGGLHSVTFIKNGQRLVGSGIGITILQLVRAEPSAPTMATGVWIFGANSANDVELSDMTLDANAARQPGVLGNPKPLLTLGGVSLNGRNNRVHRIRLINWGTLTPFIAENPDTPELESEKTKEGFPLWLEGEGASGNNVVEDCIIEQPYLSNAREVTLLNNHAHADYPNVRSVVRNNYINGDFTTGQPLPAEPVESIAVNTDGTRLIVTTPWPHRLEAGDEAIILGSALAALAQRLTVRAVTDAWHFSVDKVYTGTPNPNVPAMTVRRHIPEALRVKSLTRQSATQMKVQTHVPHWRKANDHVRIAGVKLGGQTNNPFNGTFRVTSTPTVPATETEFTVETAEDVGTIAPDAGSDIWLDRWPSQNVIIEPPDPANANTPGLMGLPGGFALARVAGRHYKAPGDFILINGVKPTESATWNGYFEVDAINPDEAKDLESKGRWLKIKLNNGGAEAADKTDAQDYDAAWIEHTLQGITATTSYGAKVHGNRLIGLRRGGPYHDLGPGPTKDLTTFNNYYRDCDVGQYSTVAAANDKEWWNTTYGNVVDLRAYPAGSWNHAQPGGIVFSGPFSMTDASFPAIRTVVARDNIVRFTDWIEGSPGGWGFIQWGIDAVSVAELTVEDNIVSFLSPQKPPLSYYEVPDGRRRNFNNRDQNGAGSDLPLAKRLRSLS